jgi:hypothetical protein
VSVNGMIIVIAGPDDIVTLRGLEILSAGPYGSGILVANAQRVNIEDCIIRDASAPGILVFPNTLDLQSTLTTNLNIKIRNTTISGSSAGIKVTSAPGVLVDVAISGSQVDNNAGGGVRVDSSNGGAITATISDSHIGLNSANGVIALSGSSGDVLVNLTNDIIASNGLAGVESDQSSGGSTTVTVSRSTLSNNGSAWDIVGGGTLLTFKNNEVTGPTGSTPTQAFFQ